jgi:hypothetical protein
VLIILYLSGQRDMRLPLWARFHRCGIDALPSTI